MKTLCVMLCMGLSLSFFCPMASAQEVDLTPIDRKVMAELDSIKETPEIVFHYRSADVDDKALADVVRINLEQFALCEELLKMDYEGRVHIFLYRDVADMQATAGTSAVAFSNGTVSIHQAMDFESVHELTHIFALQFPRDRDSVTDGFTVEGLATILAKHDENIPIHSWAAVYQSTSRLPGLVEFRRSWPKGSPNGVHHYHVAASFIGYLIDQFGIDKVKQWYVNSTEAHMVFGKTFSTLEREWLTWLEELKVDVAHRDHVLAKLGLLGKELPESYVNAKRVSLYDGKTIDGFAAEDTTKWKVENGLLIGTNAEAWTHLHTEKEFAANVGVQMKFRLVDGNAVKIRLNRSGDSSNEAIFTPGAIFLSLKSGGYMGGEGFKIIQGKWYDAIFVNEKGTGRLYLDGFLILETNNVFHSKGSLGIAIERGTLEVKELAAFEL